MVDKAWFSDEVKLKELRESPAAALELLSNAVRSLTKLVQKLYYDGVFSVISYMAVVEEAWNELSLVRVWTSANNSRLDLLIKTAQTELQYGHTMTGAFGSFTPEEVESGVVGVIKHVQSAVVNCGYVIMALENLLSRVPEVTRSE